MLENYALEIKGELEARLDSEVAATSSSSSSSLLSSLELIDTTIYEP